MQNDEHLMALVNASRSTLLRAATRLLGPADAEDAVQDAYVRALESNATTLNAAQAWLLTVVRNLAIDRLRRRQWMTQWLAETVQTAQGDVAGMVAASAEADAAHSAGCARERWPKLTTAAVEEAKPEKKPATGRPRRAPTARCATPWRR